jgi:hypothetical protein
MFCNFTEGNEEPTLDELVRQRGSYLAFLPFTHTENDRTKLLNEIRSITDQIYLIMTGKVYDRKKDLKTSGTGQAFNAN